MNPIIKQLAEQAGMNIKTNVIGTALVFGTFEGYKTSHITVEELEKFAGLIIEKCLGIVNRKEYSYHEADPLWETAQLIKEHFGVKE
jgi:hypothetical protein